MPRHSKHQREAKHPKAYKIISLALVLAGLGGWQMWIAGRRSPAAQSQYQLEENTSLASSPEIASAARRIFPYSVIPGGIGSVADVKSAIGRDPVVAAHYASLDLSKAHFVRASTARQAYVSYRIGDHIYWTAKKLKIAQGELLLTDGQTTARGRCGNLVSAVAMKPVFPMEPESKVFDAPIPDAPLVALSERVGNPIPDLGAGSASAPAAGARAGVPVAMAPVYYGAGGGGGGNNVPAQPPAPVPEPSTELFLLTGLVGLGYLLRRQAAPNRS